MLPRLRRLWAAQAECRNWGRITTSLRSQLVSVSFLDLDSTNLTYFVRANHEKRIPAPNRVSFSTRSLDRARVTRDERDKIQ